MPAGATVHPSPKPALLSEIRRVAAGRAQAEKQQQHTAGAAGAEAAGAEAAAGSAAGTAGARGAAGGSSSSSSACGEHASHPLPDTPTAADGSGTGN